MKDLLFTGGSKPQYVREVNKNKDLIVKYADQCLGLWIHQEVSLARDSWFDSCRSGTARKELSPGGASSVKASDSFTSPATKFTTLRRVLSAGLPPLNFSKVFGAGPLVHPSRHHSWHGSDSHVNAAFIYILYLRIIKCDSPRGLWQSAQYTISPVRTRKTLQHRKLGRKQQERRQNSCCSPRTETSNRCRVNTTLKHFEDKNTVYIQTVKHSRSIWTRKDVEATSGFYFTVPRHH